MTISAKAYDNDTPTQTLTYKLYWGNSTTAMDTKTSTSGNTVTFTTKTGLAEYTTQTYSWKVEVTDSKSTAISKNSSDRTYCSGRSQYCSGGIFSPCSVCKGVGIVHREHTDSYIDLGNALGSVQVYCSLCAESHEGPCHWLSCRRCGASLGRSAWVTCPSLRHYLLCSIRSK